MIVRSAAGSAVNATASVGATLRHDRFGTRLFSYSQPAKDLPAPLTFEIA
jgi:hypothetical protein